MSERTAYPLCWPLGWKRTEKRQPARFRNPTVARAVHDLLDELRRMGVPDWRVVISTNLQLRLDGLPYSNQPRLTDPGVAVYFHFRDEERVLACDRWNRVEDNLWAVYKHVQAMRGQERWGVGNLEQAFRGYTALPETTGGRHWTEVLGLPREDASRASVLSAFRARAMKAHPDHGGTASEMAELNVARAQAMEELSDA